MSQLKDFSQISQEQIYNEFATYAGTADVVEFIKAHQSIQVALLEFISEIEDKFPDSQLELRTTEVDGEKNLRLFLLAPTRSPKVIENFNNTLIAS